MSALGIDPGVSGAFAYVDTFVRPTVEFIEVERIGKSAYPNVRPIVDLLRRTRPTHVILEAVGTRPGQRNNRKLVFVHGALYGMAEALGFKVIHVYPQVWKRHFGLLGTKKDAARLLALKMWPHLAQELKRKKDVDKADALLLAAYGDLTYATD